jgi:hypothetical protein
MHHFCVLLGALDAHFNGVSTEIVFGSIFKRNVLEGLIGDSAQVLGKSSRLTSKPLRTYLNMFYVNLQSDSKRSNSWFRYLRIGKSEKSN